MEMITYKSDRRFSLLFGVLPLSLILIYGLIVGHNRPDFLTTYPIILFCFLFVILDITIGSFGFLDKKKGSFHRTREFFSRKEILVKDIQEIWYQSTWIVGGLGKSLYIRGTYKGDFQYIDFPNVGFAEKTLAQIVRDLKKENPNIKLDEGAENLLKEAK